MSNNQDLVTILKNTVCSAVSWLPRKLFDTKSARKRLDKLILSNYATIQRPDAYISRETSFITSNPVLERATGSILNYLARAFSSLDVIDIIRFPTNVIADQVMDIDLPVYSALELGKTMYENKHRGSLLSVMDQTVSAQGSRLLQSRLSIYHR